MKHIELFWNDLKGDRQVIYCETRQQGIDRARSLSETGRKFITLKEVETIDWMVKSERITDNPRSAEDIHD